MRDKHLGKCGLVVTNPQDLGNRRGGRAAGQTGDDPFDRLILFRELVHQILIAPFRPNLLDQAVLDSIEVIFRPVDLFSGGSNAKEFALMRAPRGVTLCDEIAVGHDIVDCHVNIGDRCKDGSPNFLLAIRTDSLLAKRQVQ